MHLYSRLDRQSVKGFLYQIAPDGRSIEYMPNMTLEESGSQNSAERVIPEAIPTA